MPITTACHGCEKAIFRKPYQMKTRTIFWCSVACRKSSLSTSFACANCGAVCSRYNSQAQSKTLYCGSKCRDEHGRIVIPCGWIGCQETMVARKGRHHGAQVFKIHLSKKGAYSEKPLCQKHRDLTTKLNVGLHGLTRIWKNQKRRYNHRAISSKAFRLVLFDRAGWKCEHCSKVLRWNAPHKTVIIDHRIPVFKGGETTLDNLQLLCKKCDDIKTAADKSEAALLRHTLERTGRRLTHYEKDSLINSLRAEISKLKSS